MDAKEITENNSKIDLTKLEKDRGITINTADTFEAFKSLIEKMLHKDFALQTELKNDVGENITNFANQKTDIKTDIPARRVVIIGCGAGLIAGERVARLIHQMKVKQNIDIEFISEEQAAIKYPALKSKMDNKLDEMAERTDFLTPYTKFGRMLDEDELLIKAIDQLADITTIEKQEVAAVKHQQKNFLKAQNRQFNNKFAGKQKYSTKMFKRNKI